MFQTIKKPSAEIAQVAGLPTSSHNCKARQGLVTELPAASCAPPTLASAHLSLLPVRRCPEGSGTMHRTPAGRGWGATRPSALGCCCSCCWAEVGAGGAGCAAVPALTAALAATRPATIAVAASQSCFFRCCGQSRRSAEHHTGGQHRYSGAKAQAAENYHNSIDRKAPKHGT